MITPQNYKSSSKRNDDPNVASTLDMNAAIFFVNVLSIKNIFRLREKTHCSWSASPSIKKVLIFSS